MPVDECAYTFRDLATTILPKHMDAMRAAMANPLDLGKLCEPRVGVRYMREQVGPGDGGCYVLIRDGKPFYVGISRRVLQRLRQHVQGTNHNDASLAYKMAYEKTGPAITREKAMADPTFREAFDRARQLLRGCKVAVVIIENPLELYVFEAYCAMELDTCEWNTFRTH